MKKLNMDAVYGHMISLIEAGMSIEDAHVNILACYFLSKRQAKLLLKWEKEGRTEAEEQEESR